MQNSTNQLLKWEFNRMKPEFKIDQAIMDFTTEEINKVHTFQQSYKEYNETPLVRLSELAKHLNVEEIFVKDESHRFGLNAFKVLGGIYAVGKYLAAKLNRDIESLSFEELKSPEVKKSLGEITFISTTDGNHGRGIAWAARELGHKSRIYMPKGSTQSRLEAIRSEGAFAEITDENYDDTVRYSARLAEENGWVTVQDTSWEGYVEIPVWIMQGYASLAKESIEQMAKHTSKSPTHVFLQAGVGSYAASITAFLVQYYKEMYPKIIVVEPHLANCYYLSFKKADHAIHSVGGAMNTIMAGLSCGEPSPGAWEILKNYSDASFSCDDKIAALGMRVLGNPLKQDAPIISGESGAVTAGLLYYLMTNNDSIEVRKQLGLDENSTVLLINTEGDTDEENYRKVVWDGIPSLD
ncbi:diaminopropionate ammonia-lyase [Sporosarcina sp. CAU 1771]